MISLPLAPKIIKKKGNKATFEIEALYPGYGVTIGNSLRRTLLSSLSGGAVTEVKIKGAPHEFSTLSGVMDDVISIILNLKQLRFKLFTEEPQKAALKVKGKKEVKGSSFKFPSQVELINKEAHITTLTDKNTELEIEIQIEKGIGYLPVEMRKKGKSEIGVIPIDAIFTPVRSVAFRVENMRVGERTDYDRLILDIETDETITPEEAFYQASKILTEHFTFIADKFKPKEIPAKEKEAKEEVKDIKIEDLKVSKRTANALLENNIKTVAGLLRKTEASLSELKGLGRKGIKEIKKALKKLDLELKS
jgi:DNA-directed RNA polymerase subunit alpha